MNSDQMREKCKAFFAELCDILKDNYEVVGSCNKDSSAYLVPKGTADQISYYGKPENSFRISDHWNWFSSALKCTDENMVQCRSMDMPWCRTRTEPGKATKPHFGWQVCKYENGVYHAVYGDCFDRKNRKWFWLDTEPATVAALIHENVWLPAKEG